jgi:hypothetical protein
MQIIFLFHTLSQEDKLIQREPKPIGEEIMTNSVLKKELQGYIEKMPEHKLIILKPLLSEFAKPNYIIEPANASECKTAEKHFKEYDKNPASFVPLA